MKKFKIPSYFLRTKWMLILLSVLFLIVFGRTVNTPALTKTAIVLGIGVDYKDELFEVSTQSVIMASSSSDGGETTYQTYTSSGNTISSALDDISRKMGLKVTLSHCNVLFLSISTLKLDHAQLIYPLTGMYSLPEHAIIVTGDDSPKELLSKKVGSSLSAPYLLQLTLSNGEGTSGLVRTTVKDFLARSLSRSHAAALPYLSLKKMSLPPLSNQGGSDEELYEFDLSKCLVFSDKDSFVLDGELAEMTSLFLSNKAQGTLNYKSEGGSTVEFRILDKKVSTKAQGRAVKSDIELTVELLDVQFVPTDKILSGADNEILKFANLLAQKLTWNFENIYVISKEQNIDFLGLQAKVYQSVGRGLEEDCLAAISFEPTVKLKVKETA